MAQEQQKADLTENILQLTDTAFQEWLRIDLTTSQLKVVLPLQRRTVPARTLSMLQPHLR